MAVKDEQALEATKEALNAAHFLLSINKLLV